MVSVVCGPKSIISLSCYKPTMHYYAIIKNWFSLNHNLNRIFEPTSSTLPLHWSVRPEKFLLEKDMRNRTKGLFTDMRKGKEGSVY